MSESSQTDWLRKEASSVYSDGLFFSVDSLPEPKQTHKKPQPMQNKYHHSALPLGLFQPAERIITLAEGLRAAKAVYRGHLSRLIGAPTSFLRPKLLPHRSLGLVTSGSGGPDAFPLHNQPDTYAMTLTGVIPQWAPEWIWLRLV